MTDSVTDPRRHPARGCARRAARAAVPLAAGLTLVACGPSPVDMVEHPMTTTPSRMAGEELQRSAEPEESCAPAPVPAEFPGSGDRWVPTEGPGPDRVEVPRSPERILALGTGAVDTACALGLQDLVVGTAGLPDGADVYLPDSLTGLPTVGPLVGADPDEVARAALGLRPDLIVLAGSDEVDQAVVAAVTDVAPTVVYDADIVDWTEATEAIADAYGRPRAGGDLLLEVIERAQRTADATTPSDTRVSLVSVTGGEGDGVEVQRPDTLGSLMLEAVGAERPPAQRTRDGERVPPLPHSPALGDELDGDVIFAVVGDEASSEDAAREVFASDRWTDLDAVGSQRVFVVDRAVWEGAGPVAARAVLDDIRGSINGVAPDG
ncbi:ABC transporter substrate-binding protein [Dietzia maris]|uniref:ABC transporter substrate-binding protein n=1 Tax=Dietzia maris TaxID=37915 RepID=A0AAE4R067_9ACTN|nr:ABC transporter substrate-binding protein [Dietzia maris]MDV6299904.1 ABC transporter substrate-binding protein [Dietzia maris]